ncbi:hypothetical protein KAZ66_04340 [Candidatus Woesebacteria bacterium]|nr:hypothetical protein [Candidatus Woesebacteria bacterium]
MQIVAHRINTLEKLSQLPPKYGVEIDIRGYGDQMLLNHDPIVNPSDHVELETYLKQFVSQGMSFVIFNTKEAGYEQRIIDLAAKYQIPKDKYFLLDVEFPYLYAATRKKGIREIAVRYSEAEPIEAVLAQMSEGKPLLDWVWIDTNTKLPLDEDTVKKLSPFKTALVCPDRWGRPEDIDAYAKRVKTLGMNLDMVMTSFDTIAQWEKHFA